MFILFNIVKKDAVKDIVTRQFGEFLVAHIMCMLFTISRNWLIR